jgi:uncharacterized protein with HEPN domain
MRKDDIIRIRHMLDSARDALSFTENKTRDDLEKNRMLTLSIVKSIEIIGEAATKITKETKEKYPEMPWVNIIAMRNRLIHVYFDIDLDRVWDTVTDDLPPLIAKLEKIISAEAFTR